jgi:hypothetical protein
MEEVLRMMDAFLKGLGKYTQLPDQDFSFWTTIASMVLIMLKSHTVQVSLIFNQVMS